MVIWGLAVLLLQVSEECMVFLRCILLLSLKLDNTSSFTSVNLLSGRKYTVHDTLCSTLMEIAHTVTTNVRVTFYMLLVS